MRLHAFLQTSLIVISLYQPSSPWKLELCIYGSTVTIQEQDCPYGVWFSQPWEVSSACVDGGLWAIYSDWCQERPFIWSAYPETRGCMRPSITKNVLGVVYLGLDSSGAAMSTKRNKLFLTTEYMQNTRLKNKSTLSTPHRWNLKEPEVEVLAWGNDAFSAREFSGNDAEYRKCLLKGRHTYSAGYNFPLKLTENVSLEIIKESCSSNKYHRWDSFQLLPQHLDSGIIISSLNQDQEFHCRLKNLTFNRGIRSKTFKRNIENLNFMKLVRSKDLLTTVGHMAMIDEQTERLARKLIAHVFLDEPLPDMNFVEWKFLLMAADIFDTACPRNMVPTDFFENILIFFRFILLESFDKFPPNIERDDGARDRIDRNLQKCFQGAQIIQFKNNQNNNCSFGPQQPVAEFKHANGTVEDVTVQIPDKIRINVQNFDLLLESTWKLMIFVHYYCADYFKASPQDLSTLLQRWQELMAPDIITRWQYAGKSYEMVRTLLRSVNLAETLQHLDHCVAASHMNSVYTGWVKRPFPLPPPSKGKGIEYGRKLNSALITKQAGSSKDFDFYRSPLGSRFAEAEWDEVTYCMTDYTFPVKALGYTYDKCGASKVD